MKKKTSESLPVGTILKEGDVFTLAMDPFRAGTEAMDGNWFRPVEKKKRAIITHDGVEYDAEPVPEPVPLSDWLPGCLVVQPSYVMEHGCRRRSSYHRPIPVEPQAPHGRTIELMNEKGWADSAAYIEWAKDEIARLREELGEE